MWANPSRSFHFQGLVLLVAFLSSGHGPAACLGMARADHELMQNTVHLACAKSADSRHSMLTLGAWVVAVSCVILETFTRLLVSSCKRGHQIRPGAWC